MKVITKYMLKSLIPNYLISLGVFTSLMIVNEIFRLIKYIVEKDIPLDKVSKLFVYTFPYTLALTIPMAVVVAVLLTFGRMSADSEIVALRGSGISLMKIIQPTLFFGVALSLLTLIFYDSVLPKGNQAYIRMKRLIFMRDPLADFDERQIIKIGPNSVRFDRQDKKTGMMYRIYITSRKGSVTYAKKGVFIDRNLVGNKMLFRFQLYDVTIQEQNKSNPDRFIQTFSPLVIQTFIERNQNFSKIVNHPRAMTATQLVKRIDSKSKQYVSRLKREKKSMEFSRKSLVSSYKKLDGVKQKVVQEKCEMKLNLIDYLIESMTDVTKERLGLFENYRLMRLNYLLKTKPIDGILLKMRWAVSVDYRIISIAKSWQKKERIGQQQLQLNGLKKVIARKEKRLKKSITAIERVKLQKAKRTGLDRYELQKKFSMPFACLIFTIIGAPLGMFARRSGKSGGFGYGIGIMVIYYAMLMIGKGWVISGTLNPIMAAWFPNVFIGLTGLVLIYKKIAE